MRRPRRLNRSAARSWRARETALFLFSLLSFTRRQRRRRSLVAILARSATGSPFSSSSSSSTSSSPHARCTHGSSRRAAQRRSDARRHREQVSTGRSRGSFVLSSPPPRAIDLGNARTLPYRAMPLSCSRRPPRTRPQIVSLLG